MLGSPNFKLNFQLYIPHGLFISSSSAVVATLLGLILCVPAMHSIKPRQVQVCNAQLTGVSTTCHKWAHSTFLLLLLSLPSPNSHVNQSAVQSSKWARKRNRGKIFWLPQMLIKSSAAVDLASSGLLSPVPPTPSLAARVRGKVVNQSA